MPGERSASCRSNCDERCRVGDAAIVVGLYYRINHFLLFKDIFKKGDQMKKILWGICAVVFLASNLAGCAPIIVGAALGGAAVYAVSKDTVQGDSDKPYERLWSAALTVARLRGILKQQDDLRGFIKVGTDSGQVWIKLSKLTSVTTRIRVSARKYHLPNLELAQEMFFKITEEVK